MWINQTNIGVKKILVWYCINGITLTFMHSQNLTFFKQLIIGEVITSSVLFLYAIVSFGIIVRKHAFVESGKRYEIIDYYSVLKPYDNYRALIDSARSY